MTRTQLCGDDRKMDHARPLLTIEFIPSATVEPLICVSENDSLDRAVALMRMHNFSQLPVVRGKGKGRRAVGIISWKSVGRTLLAQPEAKLEQCIDRTVRSVKLDAALIPVIAYVNEHDYVLVARDDNTLSGIVTSADLGDALAEIAGPYLLISKCETVLRSLVAHALALGVVAVDDVTGRTTSTIQTFEGDVDSLTFGDLVSVLNLDQIWAAVNYRTDGRELHHQLSAIVKLRNQVMHFRERDSEAADAERRLPYIISELEAVKAHLATTR